MKRLTVCSTIAGLVAAICLTSCRKEERGDASRALTQSFQAAAPETKQAIEVVNQSLKAGKVAEATRALAPVATNRNLTQPQREAIGVTLRQINQAIAANRALDTQEMYELRNRMFQAVHSGPRF